MQSLGNNLEVLQNVKTFKWSILDISSIPLWVFIQRKQSINADTCNPVLYHYVQYSRYGNNIIMHWGIMDKEKCGVLVQWNIIQQEKWNS